MKRSSTQRYETASETWAKRMPQQSAQNQAAAEPVVENPIPTRSRASFARENAAVESAIASVVGGDGARRLMELGDELRIVEVRPYVPTSAMQRALALMETAEGRKRLSELTWNTV